MARLPDDLELSESELVVLAKRQAAFEAAAADLDRRIDNLMLESADREDLETIPWAITDVETQLHNLLLWVGNVQGQRRRNDHGTGPGTARSNATET